MPEKYTKLFSLLLFCALSQLGFAQAYSIQLELPSYKNDTILFTHYYNGKVFVNDTLTTDSKGKATIEGDLILPEGIYEIYLNPKKQIDFLVGKDQTLSISEKDSTIKISGASESKKFQDYINFLQAKKKLAAELQKKLQENKEETDSSPAIKSQLKKLDDEVQEHWVKEAKKAKGTFYGKFVASNLRTVLDDSQIPVEISENDSALWVYKYNFQKNHYWDHFDLFDLRMWRTPTIQSRLNEYFNSVLIQLPDSVLPEATRLIDASKDQPEIFENLVSFVLNNSVKSNYMSMENVFVAIAQKYYLSGKAFWASEKTLEKIRQEVLFRNNNLVGSFAKELFLEDENGEYHSLYQQSTPFTLLIFWDPDCGHCKIQVPDFFNKVFMKTDPSQLSVMAVYTHDNKKDWLDFIDKHGLDGWINVWDPNQLSRFQINYDVRTTPMVYLLDKDKKIIAKKISVDSTMKILDELMGSGQ